MTAQDCDEKFHTWDKWIACQLPATHTEPTDEQPAGSPHESDEVTDSLTGDPTRWWG